MRISSLSFGARRRGVVRRAWCAWAVSAALASGAVLGASVQVGAEDQTNEPNGDRMTKNRVADCTFAATGATSTFVLEPGFQLVLEGVRDGHKVRRVHTVLDKTHKVIVIDLGTVEVRAVDEREWVAGRIQVTSTVHYAICTETGHVYGFGDDTFLHNSDGTVTHEGAWRDGKPDDEALPEPMIYAVPKDGEGDEGPLKRVQSGNGIVELESRALTDGVRVRNVSDRRAREIAVAAVPGEVMDLAVERKLGAKRIVVEVIAAADLAETDVIIDMDTGEVLGIEK